MTGCYALHRGWIAKPAECERSGQRVNPSEACALQCWGVRGITSSTVSLPPPPFHSIRCPGRPKRSGDQSEARGDPVDQGDDLVGAGDERVDLAPTRVDHLFPVGQVDLARSTTRHPLGEGVAGEAVAGHIGDGVHGVTGGDEAFSRGTVEATTQSLTCDAGSSGDSTACCDDGGEAGEQSAQRNDGTDDAIGCAGGWQDR